MTDKSTHFPLIVNAIMRNGIQLTPLLRPDVREPDGKPDQTLIRASRAGGSCKIGSRSTFYDERDAGSRTCAWHAERTACGFACCACMHSSGASGICPLRTWIRAPPFSQRSWMGSLLLYYHLLRFQSSDVILEVLGHSRLVNCVSAAYWTCLNLQTAPRESFFVSMACAP